MKRLLILIARGWRPSRLREGGVWRNLLPSRRREGLGVGLQ
jgi:hypothetical protein